MSVTFTNLIKIAILCAKKQWGNVYIHRWSQRKWVNTLKLVNIYQNNKTFYKIQLTNIVFDNFSKEYISKEVKYCMH